MNITYKFPVVFLDDDDPTQGEAEIVYESATIRIIRINEEPYEAILNARGYRFHLIFGSQINGNFLCIPDWNVGCELAHLKDNHWNMDSILRTDSHIDYEDATAITYALSLLSDVIKQREHTGA